MNYSVCIVTSLPKNPNAKQNKFQDVSLSLECETTKFWHTQTIFFYKNNKLFIPSSASAYRQSPRYY